MLTWEHASVHFQNTGKEVRCIWTVYMLMEVAKKLALTVDRNADTTIIDVKSLVLTTLVKVLALETLIDVICLVILRKENNFKFINL